MRPFYESQQCQLYVGDALLGLRELPSNSIDCLIADPPYCSGGTTTADRTSRSARKKYVSTNAAHTLVDFEGDQRDQRSYIYWCTLWLAEALRLAKPPQPVPRLH